MRPFPGKDTGFVGISEDNVRLIHQMNKEVVVFLHNVIARHIQTNLQARLAGQSDSAIDECVVLNEVAFDIKIVITLENGGIEIIGR